MHGYTVAAVIMVYMIYLTILSVSLAILLRLVRGLPNNGFEMIWKESVVARSNSCLSLSRGFSEETEKSTRSLS